MPWYFPWSDAIKKRACRYLLQRYMGQFLQEKLNLDQLSVDLYNGTGSISEVNLDVNALNDMGELHNLPIEFVDGYIGSISVSIPWSSLLSDNCCVEIKGLMVTIQPKQRMENVASLFDSMLGSMTTSLQMAEECLKQESNDESLQPFDGLEKFAQTIETVLCRIKVKFSDTTVRVEHVPKNGKSGVALEVRIKNIDYFDEAGVEDKRSGESENVFELPSFATKKFYVEGTTIFTDEFPYHQRTFTRSFSNLSSSSSPESKHSDAFQTAPVSPAATDQQFDFNKSEKTCNENDISTSEPINAVKISGRQEIRLKLKQAEAMPGSKVEVEVNLGSALFFLSPRQVHILKELSNGFICPDLEDNTNVVRKDSHKQMESADYQRIELELQNQLNPSDQSSRDAFRKNQGWSTHPLDNSDDEFLPMGCVDSGTNYRIADGEICHSDMDASMNSNISSSTTHSSVSAAAGLGGAYYGKADYKMNKRKSSKSKGSSSLGGLLEEHGELTSFRVRCSTLCVIILHEDILTLSADRNNTLSKSSIIQMKSTAQKFFDDVGLLSICGQDYGEFETAKDTLSRCCQLNHLRLLAAPVIIEGKEVSKSSLQQLMFTLTSGNMNVLECLFDKSQSGKYNLSQPLTPEYTELLAFTKQTKDNSGLHFQPYQNASSVTLQYNQTKCPANQTNNRGIGNRYSAAPRTDVNVHLDDCRIEFDITLVDRIHALLNPQPLCSDNVSCLFHSVGTEDDIAVRNTDKTNIEVSSPLVEFKMRFPIPDLRPLHDMNRLPWWKRSIRSDILTLEMRQAVFSTCLNRRDVESKFELRCEDVHGLFQESLSCKPISFLRATPHSSNGFSIDDNGFDWPRLVLKIRQSSPVSVLEDAEEPDEPPTPFNSIDMLMQNSNNAEPSPFSSKRVVYSSYKEDEVNKDGAAFDGEEMVLPSGKAEMSEFIEKTVNHSLMVIEMSLPNLNVHFPSKHIYEVIYNRISNDLLLWEPSVPQQAVQVKDPYSLAPHHQPIGLDLASQFLHDRTIEKFSMCRSAHYESSSDSDEPTISHFSVTEHKQQRHKQRQKESKKVKKTGQHDISIVVNTNLGQVMTCCPLRDTSGNVLPGQNGKLLFRIDESSVFIVSGYGGQKQHGYITMQSNKAVLYHKVLQKIVKFDDVVGPVQNEVPSDLDLTAYKSSNEVNTKLADCVGTGPDSLDMFTLAIKFHKESTHSCDMKIFKVALGLTGTTVRYRIQPAKHSWFDQVIDFFDVVDYPVAGYVCPAVVTELHLFVSNCAIDYRPLHLPLCTAITLDTFSISSNIVAQTATSVLRFIAEDAALFVSDKHTETSVNLKQNYTCVMDMGFFELSLRMSNNSESKSPHIDLQASNNLLHIRTCSDSFRALCDLVTYLASDQDLQSTTDSSVNQTTSLKSDAPVLSAESYVNLPHECHVHDLMAEAMRESSSNSYTSSSDEGSCDAFAEKPKLRSTDPPVVRYRKNPSARDCGNDSSDEEFCILENDPGVGIGSQSGEPQIKSLMREQFLGFKENHYASPISKTDLLKAPKHFPPPVYRYCLREISVVWHMYGGNDFGKKFKGAKSESKEDLHRRSSESGNHQYVSIDHGSSCQSTPLASPVDYCNLGAGISYSKSRPQEVTWTGGSVPSSPRNSRHGQSWTNNGGVNRDQNVLMELQMNKLRFQHEVYPNNAVQASRQVLIVHDVEIRDRLASSQINKFLYQYTSEAMPRQTHAQMVVIKALQMRPDPKHSAQECELKVSLQPLRLNLDQDALFFLCNFFSEIKTDKSSCVDDQVYSSPCKRGTVQPDPVMTVTASPHLVGFSPPDKPQSLIMFAEDDISQNLISPDQESKEPASTPIFFRSFVFYPDVPIRLDYRGKRVDMEQGAMTGLLIGLAELNCSELTLKHINYRHGLLGFDRLVQHALNEWTNDIKKSQLPSLLGGVGPMHSFVQLFQGIKDLFWLPIEQYRKDGRIVRGIQRGANSFSTSTAMAALELTNRVVHTIQSAAEIAYDMVSPGPSIQESPGSYFRYANQPADIREGVACAYSVVREGIGDTARTIYKVASNEHDKKGMTGALGGVLRQFPPTLVKPIIIATEATSNVLGGMKNQLAPDARREAVEKWRTQFN